MKTTKIICDTCGNTLSGHDWSTLWARAVKLGWITGQDAQKHYCCAKCMVLAEFPKELKKKEKIQ